MLWHINYRKGSVKVPVTLALLKNRIQIIAPYNQYSRSINTEIKAMEGWKYSPTPKPNWTVADTPRNRQQLRSLQGEPNPYTTPASGILPKVNPKDLWDTQIIAVNRCLLRKKVIIAYNVGRGKTLVALRAAEALQLYPIWIVCPKNIKLAWQQQIEQWKPDLDLSRTHLLHYEQLQQANLPPLPRVLIVDESVYIKNPMAQRSMAIKKVADQAQYVWQLCGKPAPKNPGDWHNQTEVNFPGYLRESSPVKLNLRCAIIEVIETDTGPHKKIIGWKKKEIEALYKRLKHMVVFDTTEHTHHYVTLNIPPDQETKASVRAIYQQCEHPQIKIRELSDGFIYQDGTTILAETAPKAIRLHSVLEELIRNEHNRTIVFAAFKASVDLCVKAAASAGWTTIRVDGRGWDSTLKMKPTNLYKVFQNVKTWDQPIAIIGHVAAMGEGLTLPAPTMHFYSNTYNPKERQQAEGRTRQPTTIYDYKHLPCDTLVAERLRLGKTLQSISMGDFDASLADIIKEKAHAPT